MAESEHEPGFTFVDKRRRGVEEDAAPAAAPAAARPSAPAPAAEAPGPAPPPTGRADFTSLCAMFYSEALMNLGQVADPSTGRPHVDLEHARFAIDMLAMLREKTQGNRTAEESAVLDEILAALRMGFVRASGRR
jgi:hypothetical protein